MSERKWVCRFEGCRKEIPYGPDGQVAVIAVNSHLKVHGMPPVTKGSKPVTGGYGGKPSNSSGGFLDGLLDGIGDVIGSIFD